MVMLCADCNQLKHPGTECQVPEDNMVDHSQSNKIIQAAYDRGDIKAIPVEHRNTGQGVFNKIEVQRYPYPFETTPHVCATCGSTEWHANLFYVNRQDEWRQDEPAFWCSDCDASVDIKPLQMTE